MNDYPSPPPSRRAGRGRCHSSTNPATASASSACGGSPCSRLLVTARARPVRVRTVRSASFAVEVWVVGRGFIPDRCAPHPTISSSEKPDELLYVDNDGDCGGSHGGGTLPPPCPICGAPESGSPSRFTARRENPRWHGGADSAPPHSPRFPPRPSARVCYLCDRHGHGRTVPVICRDRTVHQILVDRTVRGRPQEPQMARWGHRGPTGSGSAQETPDRTVPPPWRHRGGVRERRTAGVTGSALAGQDRGGVRSSTRSPWSG